VLPRSWDTAAAALTACAQALGDSRQVRQIAAASGLAFRLSVDAEVSLAGPHAYPFAEVLPAAAARLGYTCEFVSCNERPDSPLHADAQRRALALIAGAADAPTLIWGVHAPEFGLALRLDGEQLRVSGILDGAAPPLMPAAALGRGDVPIVFALRLTGKLPSDDAAGLWAALSFGRGPAPTLNGFFNGADAWRAVQAALVSGRIDPAGFAYSAQRWAESRAAAAAWLEIPAAKKAFSRAASMLQELASLHPFPPPPGNMLTSTQREQSAELVAEAARAEAAGLDAIAEELAARERRATEALRIVDLSESRVDLYACIRELPIDLEAEAETCRQRGPLSGKLLYDKSRLVGHVLWAPLEEALQPIVAQGRRWFIYCPWVLHELRGRGAGPRLFSALEEAARQAGVNGLLTFATGDERFLYVEALAKLGFVEVAHRGDLHLLERALDDVPSHARFTETPPPESSSEASSEARLVVQHNYHCPLLLHTRRGLAQAARQAGVTVEESDGIGGARLDGHELPHGYIPPSALLQHLTSR
jgi:GNAT superfamily N-acetyltransferase